MKEFEKLAIPDGYEFDRVENGEVILKKKEQMLPDTWEECLCVVNDVEQIDESACIIEYSVKEDVQGGHTIDETDQSFLPVGLGRPMLALCQLLICRDAWWKVLGWKPDWGNGSEVKFHISARGGRLDRYYGYSQNHILSFPSIDVRDQFYEKFRNLIEEAKGLL